MLWLNDTWETVDWLPAVHPPSQRMPAVALAFAPTDLVQLQQAQVGVVKGMEQVRQKWWEASGPRGGCTWTPLRQKVLEERVEKVPKELRERLTAVVAAGGGGGDANYTDAKYGIMDLAMALTRGLEGGQRALREKLREGEREKGGQKLMSASEVDQAIETSVGREGGEGGVEGPPP